MLGAFQSVTGLKKKIVAFLVVVGLGGGALALRSSSSSVPEPTSGEWKAGGSLFANDPNFLGKTGNSATTALVLRTMIAVLLVVALGAAAIYISRRFLPRITNLAGKGIRVIETVHLGPRQGVHLVKIGNQQLLIGSTSENITMLADVTDALPETDVSTQEKAQLLRGPLE